MKTCRGVSWLASWRLAASMAVLVTVAASVSADGAPQADALARLKSGNTRFVNDPSDALPINASKRSAAAQGQSPYATVLSCADSRVPPEVVFHTGLGDLFVVRAAGHVPDRAVLASLEYGVEQLHTPLLVVMGHEMCGIVKAAVDTPAGTSLGPNLDYLIKAIRPAASRTADLSADARLRVAILENVEETINTIVETSAPLRRLAEAQRLMIVGAYYELSTGRVHFSQPVGVPPSRVSQAGRQADTRGAAARSSSTPTAGQPARPSPAAPSKPAR
ncbi:MAG TPA: carbonic anhydrase [Vicinamibacterales bacterium]|nr:carbonic anhydrase [Vicinamibacterales bacterium]